MRNFDIYLDKAKGGQLSISELQFILEQIQKTSPGNDHHLYTLLLILGHAQRRDKAPLLENFLHYPSDPMIAKVSLQILCDYWGFTSSYISQIRQFIQGVDWDIDDDVKLIAISCAGEYLRSQLDYPLLRDLLSIAETEQENPIVHEVSIESLGRAIGLSWDEAEKKAAENPGGIIDGAKSRFKKKN